MGKEKLMVPVSEIINAYRSLSMRDDNKTNLDDSEIVLAASYYEPTDKTLLGRQMVMEACGGEDNFHCFVPVFVEHNIDWAGAYDEILRDWVYYYGVYNELFYVFWKL